VGKKISIRDLFTESEIKELFENFFPFVVLPLVRTGIITREHLDDPVAIMKLVLKHRREGIKKSEWCYGIDQEFVEHSVRSWNRGDKFVAIVVYATAVEQLVNFMYQVMLAKHGWKPAHVANLIRNININGKLSWAFEMFTKRKFPSKLRIRIERVFDIRNSIVHFKAKHGHPDAKTDSYTEVSQRVGSLKRMSISRDFSLMERTFYKAILDCDPHRQLVEDIVRVCGIRL
jgi:hypothetical protein